MNGCSIKTQCLRGSLRPASTCLPHTSLHCSTCRYHLASSRRVTRMHMSFLVLRSRRYLVEISRVIDRDRICRFFPSYSSGSSVSSGPIICHRQDFFPCISQPIASSIRQKLRFSRSSPTSLRRLMREIMHCSACSIFRQPLIPSATRCWSSAWRGLRVFVRLRLTGSVPTYSTADNQCSTTEFHHRFVVSSAGSRRARYWGLCYSFFTRQTLASWRLVLACHLISTPTTRNSTRGATLHLTDCRSEGWSLALSGSQSGCGLTDFVLIPRRRSFFGARLVDGALILTPGS